MAIDGASHPECGTTIESLRFMTDPTVQNVRAIAELERQMVHERSPLQRITDTITRLAGSGVFLALHAAWFTSWIVLNRGPHPFDPYPFSFLTMTVSLEAIFLTGIVLMSQNRMTRQADRRAHLDLQVNLLAEQELTAILQMLYALCQKAGTCAKVSDERVEQLLRQTDIVQLAVALEKELPAQT
jgi:uncharacterized membrane protein